MFNERKLRGKIVEAGYTMERISDAIGISSVSMRSKMKRDGAFTRIEIQLLSVLLNLSEADVHDIFFADELTDTQGGEAGA